ncbi:MAG: putative septum site-determining protein MinC [Chloroflexi bacterium ADurb.Bin180]|nr:MAG: putative septum site-determining protein MinC [Chloroflexi bacterium ADurb.Bin180]HOU23624.1 septum site-determining protein MinC [Anaerolineae bacterium]HQJ51822.1 septum site-determining protein MinC [Anaerolineae bacterium]
MATSQVVIKGTRRGPSITLGEGDWKAMLADMEERLQQAPSFFRDSQVHVNVGARDVTGDELRWLLSILNQRGVRLATLRTTSEATANEATALGIRLAPPDAVSDMPGVRVPTADVSEGLLVRRTLRSGQVVQHPGHIVVMGDINPGAEVIAGGDVIVWGRVRGKVHAGALGNSGAVVCALDLAPAQLRIGQLIAVSPDDRVGQEADAQRSPEMAFVLDGQIIAEPWEPR